MRFLTIVVDLIHTVNYLQYCWLYHTITFSKLEFNSFTSHFYALSKDRSWCVDLYLIHVVDSVNSLLYCLYYTIIFSKPFLDSFYLTILRLFKDWSWNPYIYCLFHVDLSLIHVILFLYCLYYAISFSKPEFDSLYHTVLRVFKDRSWNPWICCFFVSIYIWFMLFTIIRSNFSSKTRSHINSHPRVCFCVWERDMRSELIIGDNKQERWKLRIRDNSK